MSLNNYHETNLLELLNEKIDIGNRLLQYIDSLSHINGINKLKNKIKRELQFLLKKKSDDFIRVENIHCTNLYHFHAIYDVIIQVNDSVSEVEKIFLINNKKLNVDIVCENGYIWIKVIARNQKGLEQALKGDTNYGSRSVIDYGEEFRTASELYPVYYRKPKIIFHFAQGVTENIVNELKSLGIIASTIDNLSNIVKNLKNELEMQRLNGELKTNKLNLDVSTLIAYVSNLTNGKHKFRFKEPILTQQAEWETAKPVKPILDQLFTDHELYCCQTAYNDFKNIIDTVGGNEEKLRANALLSKVTVLPDNFKMSDESPQKLKVYGKIKERSRLIFEFGARIQAITVSSNEGFVRSAKQQGIEFSTFIHESRALTEQKENSAVPI